MIYIYTYILSHPGMPGRGESRRQAGGAAGMGGGMERRTTPPAHIKSDFKAQLTMSIYPNINFTCIVQQLHKITMTILCVYVF